MYVPSLRSSSRILILNLLFKKLTKMNTLKNHCSCRLSTWEDNSYLPYNDSHNASIYEFIPVGDDGQLDSCHMYSTINQTNSSCSSYVFDKKELWGVSLNERVSTASCHACVTPVPRPCHARVTPVSRLCHACVTPVSRLCHTDMLCLLPCK